MIGRALAIWIVLLLCAIGNGAFREAVLTPRLGAVVAHVLSTLMLSAIVILLAIASVAWIGPRSGGDAILIGLLWLVLVLTFEFLAGHYLFGNPWERLLADYNVLEGRIWPLVLVATFFAPLIAYGVRLSAPGGN
jgi:hypothetical protein